MAKRGISVPETTSLSCKNISAGLFSAREHALTFRESFNAKYTVRPGKIPLLDCQRDSHATSQTAICANITQTGRIRVYCSWFWVVLVGFVGFAGGFGWFWLVLLVVLGYLVVLGGLGWFWLVPGFSNYDETKRSETKRNQRNQTRFQTQIYINAKIDSNSRQAFSAGKFSLKDGASLTWNQPPPNLTVEAAGHTLHHLSSRQLHKGSINASLSWQFDLIKLNFVSLTIFFNGTAIAGVTSSGSGPEPGFENRFDFHWISNQTFARLIIFNVATEEHGTFICRVSTQQMTGFGSFQFESNVQVDVVAPPSNIAISSDLNCSADEKPKPTILTGVFDGTVVTTPLNKSGEDDGGGYRCTADNGSGKCLTNDVQAGLPPYIIAIIIVLGVLFLVISGVFTCWIIHRQAKKDDYDEERGDNKGADKQDQGAYAQSGPPAANGAGAAAEQEVGAAAIPTYEVDKSKKKKTLDEPKKEKKPGELLYAGLGDFHNPGMPTVSISPQPLPDPHERTDHAKIPDSL
ncbi:uncharacterized protein [Acropora muricata]|uniref:uncharacterized protein n=1 Tax=Acropora muricata TaxID=159855 RepID=UPI0034E55CDA